MRSFHPDNMSKNTNEEFVSLKQTLKQNPFNSMDKSISPPLKLTRCTNYVLSQDTIKPDYITNQKS